MELQNKAADSKPLEKRILIHAAVGLSLAVPLYLGIVARSFSGGLELLLLEGYFVLPLFAGWLLNKPVPAARRVGAVIIVAWLIYFLFYALQTAERLYLVNASTYPTWMAGFMENAPDPLCEKGHAEVYEKENGLLLRCGFNWSEGKTIFIGNPASLEQGDQG